MCIGLSPTSVSVKHVHAQCPQRPERVTCSLGLGLQIVVSCHVSAGIEPKSSGTGPRALNHQANSSALHLCFLNTKI